MDLLRQLPSITIPVTLVCAGNRRKEQNMHKQTVGFNWGPGAVSTAVWRGVLVRDLLLRQCGGIQAGARFVCFDGSDRLPNGHYGTSISIERVMNPMNDVMIAYEMNGARLTPDHGFPVRLIIPGVIGGRMIKYLAKITVSDTRSNSWYHYHDNRVLPSVVGDADMAKRDQWWARPECTINELNINSVICSPAHRSIQPISDPDALTKKITISGYAYNGGCKKIARVEVTLDAGSSWLLSDLDHPEELPQYRCSNDYFPRQRYWCWCFWSVNVPVRQLLRCKDIHVRAWDSTTNTLPKDLNWNLMGMMNNCWFRVQVDLDVLGENDNKLVLRFIHPTMPGSEHGGGWMRPKTEGAISGNAVRNKTTCSEVDTITHGAACYTADMVAKHSTKDDCWVVYDGKVYDCTTFLQEHPGGADSITMKAGEDCTEDFDGFHSDEARGMLVKYYVGELVTTMSVTNEGSVIKTGLFGLPAPSSGILASPMAIVRYFIDPKKWQEIVLVKKIPLTHNTRLFRFAFGGPDQLLGLPLGNHLFLRIKTNDSTLIRAYTPTSPLGRAGYFDLVIKVYFKNTDSQFPAGGVVSQYLEAMPIGGSIALKGPIGSFKYNGLGHYSHAPGKKGRCLQIGMICGGTGLTPMYQILQAILADKVHDTTKVSLIFCNHTEDDILMRKEIDEVDLSLGPDRFHLWHVLSKHSSREWQYSTGRINKAIINEHLFPTTWNAPDTADGLKRRIVLLCGPPPMITFTCLPALTEIYGNDFVDNNVFSF
ncbi:hypothetical protein BGX24_004629 [Mortierella sp. AD032]|nr:hypothetical protein BGX24_004629 [Mortierella sp. AD032]